MSESLYIIHSINLGIFFVIFSVTSKRKCQNSNFLNRSFISRLKMFFQWKSSNFKSWEILVKVYFKNRSVKFEVVRIFSSVEKLPIFTLNAWFQSVFYICILAKKSRNLFLKRGLSCQSEFRSGILSAWS